MGSNEPTPARAVSGWGGTPRSFARVVAARDEQDIVDAIQAVDERGLLARGAGRAYGDAGLNAGGILVDLKALDYVDIDGDLVTAGAGARLNDLNRLMIPQGLFVPVSPGTSHASMGGLVAADVHGKNHHRNGSWGMHVTGLRLIDGRGHVLTLRAQDQNPEPFWATVGGMGLTGVISQVTFRAIRVPSASMLVTTRAFGGLDGVMEGLREADAEAPYSVAWIDSTSPGSKLGRGIVSSGDHADVDVRPGRRPPRSALRVPLHLPVNLLGRIPISVFNEAWMRVSGRRQPPHLQRLESFFYPLDGVGDWNRLYGPRGFVQYQVVVPDEAGHVVGSILRKLREAGAPSFLSVLKRFGEGNPAPLSFPMPGWTLALDLPAANDRLAATLNALDAEVLDAGGRHYLAKDSRVSREAIVRGYPSLSRWRAARDQMDPDGVFASDLSRRLDLASDTSG
jgi:decaprenylphospho-beta-D-ribofuranose 2-oxidase